MDGNELGAVYSSGELASMLASVGENVSVNRSVVFYSPQNIRIGSNVRIDCFCVIAAGPDGISIGNHVHIGAYSALFGSAGHISMEPFSAVSARVMVFTSSDDYSEGYLTNPTIPAKYKKLRTGDVLLSKHALVGCGSVVMPGVTLGVGASAGAMTFIHRDVADFAVVFGNPMRVVAARSRRLFELEAELLDEERCGTRSAR